MATFLGIDIGGSGIKGAVVNAADGELVSERLRVDTPQPSTPPAVAQAVKTLVEMAAYSGPIGCTYPGIVKNGTMLSAANVDAGWIGCDGQTLFNNVVGMPFIVLNDADAAGEAEMVFGAGKGKMGVVIMLTFGTGIGSALFLDGKLVPNTEFGHLHMGSKIAEARASARVKEEKDLSWSKWGKRVNDYLTHLERIFTPDMFIIGGGISKRFDRFIKYIKINAEIVPAHFFNDAGIVGAAMAAAARFPDTSAGRKQPDPKGRSG
ncbi:MAG: ROK family protein [Chloroflexi bacterium]|nr:MAG: polyphosphate glucokinase [Chloroflexi bacterium OLB13]MBC6955372.1 ROK family protein [Chloroflexota bacterium]MBV6435589.1 Polyphosphate glucokinase [Anaerolineae bacterium]MCQ3950883.1 ROK family protein [Planctomycetota bacterium]MDL1915686.1 ROK family protein [Anaerolineae bacterium CFX4]OQY86589.1 MAG: polyphosphate glucokinase [Anaerolineae bacterium UTCFX5]